MVQHTNFIALLCICIGALLLSCSSEKKDKVAYYSLEESPDIYDSGLQSGDEVEIPFREEGGVKYITVNVNGVGFEMIFDTGCSGALISLAEAQYLAEKGKLTKEDILGMTQSQIADGSIVENMVVNLKEVIIGDRIRYPDVTATVSSNINAPLLLGNEVLNRHASVTIDNENNVLRLNMK